MNNQFYFWQFTLAWVKVKWFQVLLCITYNSIKHQSFVKTQLNNKTVLIQAIQISITHLFSLSLNVEQFQDIIRSYHSGAELTWERWQWRGTPHSPKLQHYWSPTIRLINVISRTLIEGVLSPTEKQLLYSTASADWESFLCSLFVRVFVFSVSMHFTTSAFCVSISRGLVQFNQQNELNPALYFFMRRLNAFLLKLHISLVNIPHAVGVFNSLSWLGWTVTGGSH